MNTEKTSCIFCDIANGAIASEKLFEDELVFAIRDINPKAPVHLLIIIKEHIVSPHEMSPEHFAHMQGALKNIISTFDVTQGYRLIINSGSHGGQEVPHVHMHVLAGEPLGPMRLQGEVIA